MLVVVSMVQLEVDFNFRHFCLVRLGKWCEGQLVWLGLEVVSDSLFEMLGCPVFGFLDHGVVL